MSMIIMVEGDVGDYEAGRAALWASPRTEISEFGVW